MKDVGARQGALVWRDSERRNARAVAIRDGEKRDVKLRRRVLDGDASSPFLYDMARGRGLRRDAERNMRPIDPFEAIGSETAALQREAQIEDQSAERDSPVLAWPRVPTTRGCVREA